MGSQIYPMNLAINTPLDNKLYTTYNVRTMEKQKRKHTRITIELRDRDFPESSGAEFKRQFKEALEKNGRSFQYMIIKWAKQYLNNHSNMI